MCHIPYFCPDHVTPSLHLSHDSCTWLCQPDSLSLFFNFVIQILVKTFPSVALASLYFVTLVLTSHPIDDKLNDQIKELWSHFEVKSLGQPSLIMDIKIKQGDHIIKLSHDTNTLYQQTLIKIWITRCKPSIYQILPEWTSH